MFRHNLFSSQILLPKVPIGLFVFFCVFVMSVNSLTAQEIRSERERVMIQEGLERGIQALRALGRNDEADHLTEIAKQIKVPIDNPERRQDRDAADRPANDRNQADREQNERAGNDRVRADRQARNPDGQNGQMQEIHQQLRKMSQQIEQMQQQLNELRDRR